MTTEFSRTEIEAAKLLIRVLEELGRPVDDRLRVIAADRKAPPAHPAPLTANEFYDLASFNAGRRAGFLYDADTLARMEQLQQRFDCLGYTA